MQPTIEVRQPEPRPSAPSDADIRGTPAPRESGVIVPTARPPNLQPPKVVAPVADTTESVIDTRGAQTVRDTGVVPSEPVVASSVAVDSELPAKLPLLSNRRVLITAAVVVGTGIGLALGLSGHLSSRAGKDEVTPSAASTAGLEQPRLSSSRPSDSLAVSATPVPSVVTHSTPPTETGSASATQNRTIHAPPPRTATPAIPSAVRKRPSSEGPQPRYKVDDLE